MRALEELGVPHFTASRSILEKYRLHCLPQMRARPRQGPSDRRVQTILALYRWPRTKAAWVRAMWWRNVPTFPLPAAVVQMIPPKLPGPLPKRIEELAFGRPLRLDMENIAAVEEVITSADGASLWHERRACTAGGRGHLWIEFRSLTYARGRESYCAHCLVVELVGFRGWPD